MWLGRINEKAALEFAAQNGVEVLDSTKGFVFEPEVGDEITFGGLFLTTMGKSLFTEAGNDFAKGAFWVSEAKVKRGTMTFTKDIAAATLAKVAAARNKPNLKTVDKTVKVGRELFEELCSKKGLTKAQREFNFILADGASQREKLNTLKGKTLKVIAVADCFALRFNRDKVEEWGSKPEHYKITKVFFFEEKK